MIGIEGGMSGAGTEGSEMPSALIRKICLAVLLTASSIFAFVNTSFLVVLPFVVSCPLCYYYYDKHRVKLVLLGFISVAISFAIGMACTFTTSGTPLVINQSTSFCGYSLCDATTDEALRLQYQAMSISDAACAAVIKPIICSRCIASSGELFDPSRTSRGPSIPLLCNSTSGDSYCEFVWQSCKDAAMVDSRCLQPHPLRTHAITNITTSETPAASPLSTTSKLTDFWVSQAAFCSSLGGDASSSPCFNGHDYLSPQIHVGRSLMQWQPSSPPHAMCIEKIYAGNSYAMMVAHPDDSGRVFLSSRFGRIWLVTMPKHGSLQGIDGGAAGTAFLDLSDRVHHFAGGLLIRGIAFHPEFTRNGRFFVSYTCDSARLPTCGADQRYAANGAKRSRYYLVVAEFSAIVGAHAVSKGMTETANPNELRRIFTMGLPQPHQVQMSGLNHGQILFSPSKDGYLYVVTGHGIKTAAGQIDFSWIESSSLGKIIRLDINCYPEQTAGESAGSRGNKSNHSTSSDEKHAEIIAMGIGNPRGCSFDPYRQSHMYCGVVVNQNETIKEDYEEVRLIDIGGGNYVSYTIARHSGHPSTSMLPTITGGLLYRGSMDPYLYGNYLYVYSFGVWAATETPQGSGQYKPAQIPIVGCSASSPVACTSISGRSAITGVVLSFGVDNNRDAFLLTTGGVDRVVRPDLCHPTSRKPASTGPDGALSSLPTTSQLSSSSWVGVVLSIVSFFLFMWWYLKQFCSGNDGGSAGTTHNCNLGCCNNIMCCMASNYTGMAQYIGRSDYNETSRSRYTELSRVPLVKM